MKTKLLLGMVFLGIVVLAIGGFTVRRSRRALRVVVRPAPLAPPASRRSGAPASPAYA
jgi:hypothetical protein